MRVGICNLIVNIMYYVLKMLKLSKYRKWLPDDYRRQTVTVFNFVGFCRVPFQCK